TWAGRVTIARDALAAFRAALAERDITVPRLVLAGHSEGAVVVSVMTRDGTATDGVVLLAGPSVGILGVMREQVPAMRPPDDREAILVDLDRVIGAIRGGEPIPEELRNREGIGGLAMMPPDGLRYMRECDATDPAAAIADFAGPVLIMHGGRDPNLGTHHAERLREARGSRPTTVTIIPELQHMLKVLPPGVTGQDAFALQGETDPRVADAVAAWVCRLPAM
ncbi:MAG: alpha/beta hydrolase family protein, partial [Gemmatimonadaceae bacterium]